MNLAELAAKSSSRPTGPAPKRMRTEANTLQLYQTLGETLLHMRKWVRSNGAGVGVNIEIEIRIGMIVIKNDRRWKETATQFMDCRVLIPTTEMKQGMNLEFKSGVDEIYAEHLKGVLIERGFTSTTEPTQKLRLDNQGNRWLVNTAGAVMGHVETKDRFYRNDFALISHEYDIRIDGAREICRDGAKPLTAEEEKQLASVWTQERLKKRLTFRSKDNPIWKVDLTEVECSRRASSGLGGGTTNELELEFELEASALQSWLEGEDENNEKTTKVASSLLGLINLCIPHHLAAPKEAEMETVTDECRQEVMRLTEMIKSSADPPVMHSAKGLEFIGSKPVNLLHKSIATIRRRDYFVTEKSDGTRYLLFVVNDIQSRQPIAVLMDQNKTIFKMRGSHEIGRALSVGTVLDGELVCNRTFKETVFLVFDVLMIQDRPELHHAFGVRMQKIERDIMPRCTEYINRAASVVDSVDRPTKVIRKVFYSKRDLSTLISKMCFEDGERVFMDGPRRHHKSDGIIFQPDTPYKFLSDIDLLKWKWPELQSVDLQVLPQKKDGEIIVTLMAIGPDHVLIDCTKRVNTHVGLGKFDTHRLLADIQEDGGSSAGACIAECAYSPTIGSWRYLRLRKDKEKPNHIDTVLGVFAEMAEAISVEELEYSLLQSPGTTSDFHQQLGKMKKQLLDWQRGKSAKESK